MELKPTWGSAKFEGVVVSIDEKFDDVAASAGKNAYRKLQFGVKTSQTNVVYFELFGAKSSEVGVKDANGVKSRIPFDMRNNLSEGYKLTWALTCGVEQDPSDEKKTVKKTLVPYDAIEHIHKNIKIGDSVFILGSIDFSTYEKSGEKVLQRKYSPRIIYKKSEPINFDAENFVEVSSFEQEIVITGTYKDEEKGKLLLNANVIKNATEWVPALFVIDLNENREFAEAFGEEVQYGDFVKVSGRVLWGAIKTEKKEEPATGRWGGKKPAGYDGDFLKDKVNELRIEFADETTFEPGKYSEADFVPYGVTTFKNDNNKPLDISDDDLPF